MDIMLLVQILTASIRIGSSRRLPACLAGAKRVGK